jgi:hypothetical protein
VSLAEPRPAAPAGARNLVVVVLDSLRYDAWLAAPPSAAAQLGKVERRWSYASSTAPSHFNMLSGLFPHASPSHVYASEYYKQDFDRYGDRLGIKGLEFKALLPSIWLPSYLRSALGYRTEAMVSMPVLNSHTVLNRDFDGYRLMPTYNDMNAMVDAMEFDDDRPGFWLLNVGETHYPLALPGEPVPEWPWISGVHGVVRDLASHAEAEPDRAFFTAPELKDLQERQVAAIQYLDGVIARLFDRLPSNTWVVITSDHGELFGEDGYFGHGPIFHEKVFEVPFVEGLVP